MSEEEKDNTYKISIPIITNQEIVNMENLIERHYESIYSKIAKEVAATRDEIILQLIIKHQQKELDKKDRKIEELQKEAGYKKCILCQKIYKPKKSNQIYCSKSCLNKVMCKRYKQRHKEQILEYAKKYRAKKKVDDKDERN